jgi:hypothetical protein|tara:strand:+ start:1580 stop:2710 length:1131 start_codon:yes stop_codon:yes gene_type:complete
MSRGTNLQRMEEDVTQSKTAVNANAKPAEPMGKLQNPGEGLSTNVEDLGGPTPENYSPTNDSAKLKTPGGTLKQVRDVVNKGAVKAEEVETEDDVVIEQKYGESPEKKEMDMKKDDDLAGAPNQKKKMKKEDIEVEEYDMEDDVNALLGGEELSEEFKAKAKTIFEAAINSKIAEIRATIEEEHEARIAEELAEEKEALQERVDSYLEYVSDEWMEENTLAIEHGLKTELTESFLSGMKSLFEENYVTIPDDKYDVLESMVEKLDDMETKLNEQIEKNIGLNNRLAESVADGILDTVSDGLAATQKEKLASLAESVEFEGETEYREKLETLKESYFPGKTSTAKTETLTEGEAAPPDMVSGSMGAYLKTLSAFKQN